MGRYPVEEGGEVDQREGGGTATEGGGKSRGNTLTRGELQENGPGNRKVILKQRLEDRQEHHSHNTRRGS